MTQLSKPTLFSDRDAVLVCDGQCDKAWGINTRPRFYFQESLLVARRLAPGTRPRDPDDYIYVPDDLLGTAPADPGTYEGGHGKPSAVPLTDASRMNKWCARECERCALLEPGEPLVSPNLKRPKPNVPGRPDVYASTVTESSSADEVKAEAAELARSGVTLKPRDKEVRYTVVRQGTSDLYEVRRTDGKYATEYLGTWRADQIVRMFEPA